MPRRYLRYLVLLVLAAFVAGVSGRVAAQDPQTITVQRAARDWLVHADKLDSATTWKLAGERFRTSGMTLQQWSEALQAARAPWGDVEQRAFTATRFANQVPGVPPGEYALVQFRTAWQRHTEGHESVTLEREADGAWRVIGYFMR